LALIRSDAQNSKNRHTLHKLIDAPIGIELGRARAWGIGLGLFCGVECGEVEKKREGEGEGEGEGRP
jgi:hypothetical protein